MLRFKNLIHHDGIWVGICDFAGTGTNYCTVYSMNAIDWAKLYDVTPNMTVGVAWHGGIHKFLFFDIYGQVYTASASDFVTPDPLNMPGITTTNIGSFVPLDTNVECVASDDVGGIIVVDYDGSERMAHIMDTSGSTTIWTDAYCSMGSYPVNGAAYGALGDDPTEWWFAINGTGNQLIRVEPENFGSLSAITLTSKLGPMGGSLDSLAIMDTKAVIGLNGEGRNNKFPILSGTAFDLSTWSQSKIDSEGSMTTLAKSYAVANKTLGLFAIGCIGIVNDNTGETKDSLYTWTSEDAVTWTKAGTDLNKYNATSGSVPTILGVGDYEDGFGFMITGLSSTGLSGDIFTKYILGGGGGGGDVTYALMQDGVDVTNQVRTLIGSSGGSAQYYPVVSEVSGQTSVTISNWNQVYRWPVTFGVAAISSNCSIAIAAPAGGVKEEITLYFTATGGITITLVPPTGYSFFNSQSIGPISGSYSFTVQNTLSIMKIKLEYYGSNYIRVDTTVNQWSGDD